jgi:hypothetical protein
MCVDAATALSDLIFARVRVAITPHQLRVLIGSDWSKLTTLAHAIHDREKKAPPAIAEGAEPLSSPASATESADDCEKPTTGANGRVAFVRRGAQVDTEALAAAGYAVVSVSDVERDVRLS